MIEVHEFKPFKPVVPPVFKRVDLEIYGIDHFRQSYTGMVYINVGDIEPTKIKASDSRCAGRFSVFGHAECTGDEGHCSFTQMPGRFDVRRSHPLTPAFKRVTVTDAVQAALEIGDEVAITIVAADEDGAKERKTKSYETKSQLLVCKGLQLVFFA